MLSKRNDHYHHHSDSHYSSQCMRHYSNHFSIQETKTYTRSAVAPPWLSYILHTMYVATEVTLSA